METLKTILDIKTYKENNNLDVSAMLDLLIESKFNSNLDIKTRQEISILIDEYIKDESGFNDIPNQYKEKVFALANFQCGNSYEDLYYMLINLVEIFN